MFKPAVNAIGCLTGNISNVANVLPIDAVSAGILAVALANPADWTYLKIGNEPACEYVKVTAISGTNITVTRAREGTTGLVFAALTPVQYVLTAAAVTDMQAAFVNVQLEVELPLTMQTIGPNNFKISLDPIGLENDDGSIVVSGEWGAYIIALNPAFNGCCDPITPGY